MAEMQLEHTKMLALSLVTPRQPPPLLPVPLVHTGLLLPRLIAFQVKPGSERRAPHGTRPPYPVTPTRPACRNPLKRGLPPADVYDKWPPDPPCLYWSASHKYHIVQTHTLGTRQWKRTHCDRCWLDYTAEAPAYRGQGAALCCFWRSISFHLLHS
jgi:hypothetical protein